MTPRIRFGMAAFSLVELLITFGIVAILATLLLSAFQRTKRGAASVLCASNLRQIGQAELQYAGDHDGALSGSVAELSDYLGGSYDYANKKWPEGAKSIFVCPIRKASSDGWYSSPIYLGSLVKERSYGPNYHITGTDTTGTDSNSRRVALQQMKSSKTMMFMDSPKTVGVWSPSTTLTYPHDGWVNVLFVDGHVQAMNREQMNVLGDHIQHVFWRGYNWFNSPSYTEE